MDCPLRKNKECPQHGRDAAGCALWCEIQINKDVDGMVRGCALAVTPRLILEVAGLTACVAKEASQTSAEVSALRVENIKEHTANRVQFVALAQGHVECVAVNHNSNNFANAAKKEITNES